VGIGLFAAQSSNVACETLSSVCGLTNAPISSLYLIGSSGFTVSSPAKANPVPAKVPKPIKVPNFPLPTNLENLFLIVS